MADKRAFFKLDVGYLMNPKVVAVGIQSPSAVLLHIAAMGYAAQHLTDGVVPLALAQRIAGATAADAEICFKHGLLEDRHDGDVAVHDYLEHQRSAADAKRDSVNGKKGAERRWGGDGDADGSPDGMAPAIGRAMASATKPPMAREREEREREEIERRPRKRPSTPMPDGWQPNDTHRRIAGEKHIDIAAEATKFHDWTQANDRRYVDWDAGFRTWLGNAKTGTAPTTRPGSSVWDRGPTGGQP